MTERFAGTLFALFVAGLVIHIVTIEVRIRQLRATVAEQSIIIFNMAAIQKTQLLHTHAKHTQLVRLLPAQETE